MHILHSYKKKSRGVTPVIATVLLIGLVVIAGIGVALVIFGTINAPPPMKVSILSISDFETTDDNTLIDHFSVTLGFRQTFPINIFVILSVQELISNPSIKAICIHNPHSNV